jgi:hypothetical protein
MGGKTQMTAERDEEREKRITYQIIVDAYDGEEQAMGWYYYLEAALECPFKAKCIKERRISPLKVGEIVEVIGMAAEDDCMKEMFVVVKFKGSELGIPLSQLECSKASRNTEEAIADWHYWIEQDYTF